MSSNRVAAYWRNTAKISEVALFAAAGDLVAGSIYAIYGVGS